MTQLLVSVRSAAEASRALSGGADVIDVKEPGRGALGAADPNIWQEVNDAVAGRAPVSVALGELHDFSGDLARGCINAFLSGICWAKLGLAGCGSIPNWHELWRGALESLPNHLQHVAVVYADWSTADAPRPEAILEVASSGRATVVLIDTYDKSAGHLLNHLGLDELHALSTRARAAGMKLALAGSLRSDLIAGLASIAPDFIAVRGAVCEADRESAVSEQLVRHLSSEVHRMCPSKKLVATANA